MPHKKREFTLIGYPLSHSFSKKYFTQKFEKENIPDCEYTLSPLENIKDFPRLLTSFSNLVGLNVTIPYKEKVIPYLDEISEEAQAIGAVNTIKIENGQLKGYNTDVYGFEKSLLSFLQKKQNDTSNQKITIENALVLGTGGAAKAVVYVLKKIGIEPILVSRQSGKGDLTYADLDTPIFSECKLIVNATPLGMSPNLQSHPNLPYHRLNKDYFLYDLVYNPEKTVFLMLGNSKGAATKNGLEMLHLQAEKAWKFWTADGGRLTTDG
ncbi:MAG TPA: shikimate dehydrogenase [Phaeodactylibacter sp.]|nr:shikimate dehydrogenase [Phaeodactylibacter sp.]